MINEQNPSPTTSPLVPLESAVRRMSDDLFLGAETAEQDESDEAEDEREDEAAE